MEQRHKDAIQRNFTSLVERTDLDSVVNALYERGVFSEQMIEPYQDTNESSRDRKRKLYRDITKRGPRAFGHLIDVLWEMGYWDIVGDLDPNNPLAIIRPNPISSNHVPNREPAARPTEKFLSITTEKEKDKKNRTKLEAELQKSAALVPAPAPAPPDADNAVYIPPFTVIKSTKFAEYDGDPNKLPHYKTRGRQRGVLVLFSYIEFQHNIEDSREGANRDNDNLMYLFSEFGLKTLKYLNLTKQETIDTLKSLEKTLEGNECVFIVVCSHGHARRTGSEYDIRCSDGQLISDLDILGYFSNKSLPALRGIPKVVIFQTCRGSDMDYVYASQPEPGAELTDGTPERPGADAAHWARDKLVEHPKFTDMLIAYSTLPGNVSYRNNKLGSWYIQMLCDVFAARAHDTHVVTLFSFVDQRMRDKYGKQTSSVTNWGFNRRLYLHPGLFEDSTPATGNSGDA